MLVAGLEIASADDSVEVEPVPVVTPEDPDMCVGCDDDEEVKEAEEDVQQQLTVEIRIDPVTGNIRYVIKGITIDQ